MGNNKTNHKTQQFVQFLLSCNSASHCFANLESSLIIRTVKGGVSKRVVTQRHITGSRVISLTEHFLSEHFAQQQRPIMIPSHVVIYLKQKDRQKKVKDSCNNLFPFTVLVKLLLTVLLNDDCAPKLQFLCGRVITSTSSIPLLDVLLI